VSKAHPVAEFRDAAARPRKPLRIAFSEDLGVTQTSREVVALCRRAVAALERDGIAVDEAHPDLSMMAAAFDVPRALDYAQSYGADLDDYREIYKPEVVWNIERGLSLDAGEILRSRDACGQVFANATGFMQDFDVLLCPATIVPAYPVEERYLGYSDGLEYGRYYQWLAICCAITATTLPVITLPCGKTDDGLPVGVQLVGRAHGDADLFCCAAYIESLLEWNPSQCLPLGS
jgi:amidase